MKFIRMVMALPILVCACTDTSAVKSFAALAPDAGKLHALTLSYADTPRELLDLDALNRLDPKEVAALQADEPVRLKQIAAIDGIHAVLVDYMQALGALADNSLVQTSADPSTLTDSLTALQTAKPGIGLSDDMIGGIGVIGAVLVDAATSAYRQEKIGAVIARSEASFQKLVAAEKLIVGRGVIPELKNQKLAVSRLEEIVHALQGEGAADIAAKLLLRRFITSKKTSIDRQIQAGNDYVVALDDIAKAHTVLFNERADLLSESGAKSATSQIGPLLKEAYTSLQSLKKT